MATLRMILLIAMRNLVQARVRTLFLGTALTLVTMLLVILMGLSQGISDNIVRSATTLSTGHVNVAGFFKATSTDSAPLITDASRLKKIVRENTEGLDYVVDRNRGWARIISPTGALASLILGVDIEEEERLVDVLQLAPQSDYKEGGSQQILGDASRLADPNTVVLFATQAERLEVDVGDKLTLRSQTRDGRANTVDVTIVAVARDIGILSNFSMFVPKQVVLDLYQLKPDTSGAIQIYLDDIDRSREVMEHLRLVLEKEGYELMEYQPAPFFAKFGTTSGEDWIGQKIDLTVWSDEVEFLMWVLTALDTVSYALIAILIAIIAVGVMNTMWISVRKRTSEIGTLRAMGMTKSRVFLLFISEAFLLGLFASLLGATLATIIALSINAAEITIPVDAVRAILLSDKLVLAIGPEQFLIAIGMLTSFTVISAMWPSIRAARMQPVEAIQQTE
ncbi:MAG: FtsX-like permease family protein [Myxococcota bacterium]|nr:FtsX-like permease family protein [Myxococcota bacterium]